MLASLLGLAAALIPNTARADCKSVIPQTAARSGANRAITARDLIELREIGSPDSASFASPSPFAISPDGTRVAYVINQANLASNSYCRALVVSMVRAPGRPRVLDRGGELIKVIDVQQGYYLPTGMAEVIAPIWSPDGSSLAYLRRDAGRTQAWVAIADGSVNPHQAASAPLQPARTSPIDSPTWLEAGPGRNWHSARISA